MSLPDPLPGMVIPFGYVWKDHHAKGEQEPRKDERPCMILSVKDNVETGEKAVSVLPITHTAPPKASGIKIKPDAHKALKLDGQQSWLVTSERNSFIWPREPTPELGPLKHGPRQGEFNLGRVDKNFYLEVFDNVKSNRENKTFKNVDVNISRSLDAYRDYVKQYNSEDLRGMRFDEKDQGNENSR